MPERRRPVAALYAPETRERDTPRVTRCCARCRRGVPGFGELPCGYDLRCPNHCHEPKPETKETSE